MYKKVVKRLLDSVLAAIGIVVLCIPAVIIAVAIKVDSKGTVIFTQEREGRKRKKFKVYKFRTMCENAYEMGGIVTSSHDARITKVGAVLRKTSLDEIPQLVNILKGEMAIIGPRPILDWEFEPYAENKEYNKRFSVLPGLFCTVDLDYRAEANRDLQFKMDAEYAEEITFIGDVKILLGIVKTVVSGKNVYKND